MECSAKTFSELNDCNSKFQCWACIPEKIDWIASDKQFTSTYFFKGTTSLAAMLWIWRMLCFFEIKKRNPTNNDKLCVLCAQLILQKTVKRNFQNILYMPLQNETCWHSGVKYLWLSLLLKQLKRVLVFLAIFYFYQL